MSTRICLFVFILTSLHWPGFTEQPKDLQDGAGEMAPRLKELVALPEDLSWSPSTHVRQLTTTITPVPGNLMPSSDLPWDTQAHTQR